MRVGVCRQVSPPDSKQFRAILKTHQNMECKRVTYSKCVAAASLLWRKTRDPWAKTGLSQANSLSFSSAWQVHYYSLTCPNQSWGENFIPKRRYPVIWQKWHLPSGHVYTTMVQIMVLHTEINLDGVLSWHSSNTDTKYEALHKHVFVFECTNHTRRTPRILLISFSFFLSLPRTDEKVKDKMEEEKNMSLPHLHVQLSCHTPTHKRPLQGKKCV